MTTKLGCGIRDRQIGYVEIFEHFAERYDTSLVCAIKLN